VCVCIVHGANAVVNTATLKVEKCLSGGKCLINAYPVK